MRIDPQLPGRLAKLAEVAVHVGVNLAHGQELIVTAPLEAHALVRSIAKCAYGRGAKLVTCLYDDPQMLRDRLNDASDDALGYAAGWLSHGVVEALEKGAARLFVVAPYPDLLAGVPAERTLRVHSALGQAMAAEMAFTSESRVNWSTAPFVTSSWARTVFPGIPDDEAARRLWEAVLDATRVLSPDPVAAWKAHDEVLRARRDLLQGKRYAALHFYDGQTDLTVGLADGHRWVGGSVTGTNGIPCMCNLPTEEVFTSPHRLRTKGHVALSRPLALAGTVVEGGYVSFREGAVTTIRARTGQDMLEKLLASDEGACRLGEVGLVPNGSPIAHSGVLFYCALFDENAASHIAFGQSYAACLSPDGERAPAARGANQSAIHVDCMIGSPSMNVDGVTQAGHAEPVMRAGEFVL
jgi:aminopeptidase